jgi:uncharacterized protein DUF4440
MRESAAGSIAGHDRGSAVTRLLIPLCGVLLAVVIGVWAYRWWTGEEHIIKERLKSLAAVLSPSGDSEFSTISRIGQLRGYFAPDVRVHFGGDDIISRDALLALLARWQPPSKSLKVEFVDVSVTVEEDTALASLTAKLSNTDASAAEDSIADAREGVVTLRKLNGEWVIASVESTDTLQR